MEVSDRRLDAGEYPRGVEETGRARRGRIGDLAVFVGPRPALARIDEPKVVKREIRHRARAHADVDRELGPHQNDRRASAQCVLVLSVPAPTMAGA